MIYIILPAFNEDIVIKQLIREIIVHVGAIDYRIIVVDDGSQDKTSAYVKDLKSTYSIDLITHAENKGLGVALQSGILHCMPKINDDDILITMDADNTHRPEYIPLIINEIVKKYDLVIASRYAPGGSEIGLSIMRSLFSKFANTLMKNLFPIPEIRDYTSGFRGYKGILLKKGMRFFGDSLITEHGFTCMAELLIKLSFIEDKIGEIPFMLRYDLKETESKMPVIKTIARYVYLWSYLKKVKKTISI